LTGDGTKIKGIGNDCGGAYSAIEYIEFGADNIIGEEGCVNNMALSVSLLIGMIASDVDCKCGDTDCSKSSTGMYCVAKHNKCYGSILSAFMCVAGQYQNSSDIKECTMMTTSTCSIGEEFDSPSAKSIANLTGSSQDDGICSSCVAGFYKDTATPTRCISCPLGYTTNNLTSSTSCVACTPGFYSDVVGSPNCIECPAGKANNQNASSSPCKICGPGKYQGKKASTFCDLCPAGKKLVVGGNEAEYHNSPSDCEDCGILQFR